MRGVWLPLGYRLRVRDGSFLSIWVRERTAPRTLPIAQGANQLLGATHVPAEQAKTTSDRLGNRCSIRLSYGATSADVIFRTSPRQGS
jgi:hypothetical protein